jgi:2-pyrone-4,6-dicarboxylate lactonase
MKLPTGATDSHFHIFESPDQYPYHSSARYSPPLAPLDDYLRLAERDGIERMVFVQPSAYGTDNRAMLDAMARLEPARRRGVVALDISKASETELVALDMKGVRGLRVNVSPYQAYEPGLRARVAADAMIAAEIVQPLRWHLDFLTPGWLTAELIPTLRDLQVDYTVAHLGLFAAAQGVQQPGFGELLDLARTGRAWIKITGLYRISQLAGFDDVAPLVSAAVAANPNRVIWGSDWPHISFADRVTNARLLELLRSWVPDEETFRKILVDNPARLFGF